MKRVPVSKPTEKDQFIKGQKSGKNYPWSDADDRIIKPFNLRLPESLHQKLEFIKDNTPYSIHSFIMEVVEKAVEKELKDLLE